MTVLWILSVHIIHRKFFLNRYLNLPFSYFRTNFYIFSLLQTTSKSTANDSPFLTPSLPSHFDNDNLDIFNDLIPESSEQVGPLIEVKNKLDTVRINLNSSCRFEVSTAPVQRYGQVPIKCSIDLDRIKNVDALIKHKNNTSLKSKMKKCKRKPSCPPNHFGPNVDVVGDILREMDRTNAKSDGLRVQVPQNNVSSGDCESKNFNECAPIRHRRLSPEHWNIENGMTNKKFV